MAFFPFIALLLIMVVGHVMWLAAAWFFRLLLGTLPPPPDAQESITSIQSGLNAILKENLPKVAKQVDYHSPSNLHISLIRFGKVLPEKQEAAYASVIKSTFDNFKPFHAAKPLDLSSKVRGTTHLHLDTTNGWITIPVSKSDTLTQFVNPTKANLQAKWPTGTFMTDKPDKMHISIAKVNLSALKPSDVQKLQATLATHQFAVTSNWFPIQQSSSVPWPRHARLGQGTTRSPFRPSRLIREFIGSCRTTPTSVKRQVHHGGYAGTK